MRHGSRRPEQHTVIRYASLKRQNVARIIMMMNAGDVNGSDRTGTRDDAGLAA